ncbi:MAG: RNA polymerase sigma factor [Oscillospiraceae bacterium]|nr:RNA polymerase sigma factor [Oscillospiraceae bacterium]
MIKTEQRGYPVRGGETYESLAELAAKGDDESFVALCDALKTVLFRTAKGILGDDRLALDAVSEAVYRAYKGIRRLRHPKYAATWFTRILINAAYDIYRTQKRETALDEVRETACLDDYDDLEFKELISSLSPGLRKIISLKYYSEFTLEEISSILKIPVGTVKSRLNRALKQLRTEING